MATSNDGTTFVLTDGENKTTIFGGMTTTYILANSVVNELLCG